MQLDLSRGRAYLNKTPISVCLVPLEKPHLCGAQKKIFRPQLLDANSAEAVLSFENRTNQPELRVCKRFLICIRLWSLASVIPAPPPTTLMALSRGRRRRSRHGARDGIGSGLRSC